MDTWFPINFKLPNNVQYKKPLYQNNTWQIFETDNKKVLIVKDILFGKWEAANLIDRDQAEAFVFGEEKYAIFFSKKDFLLQPISKSSPAMSKDDALSFAHALKETRKIITDESISDGIFFEQISKILPTYSLEVGIDDDKVLGSWLTGGVAVPAHSFRRMTQLTGWRTEILHEIVEASEVTISKETNENNKDKIIEDEQSENTVEKKNKLLENFSLPGRPLLENFFNEHVVDIIKNKERYKALGIGFPSAVILHGPPGCGKTYAVEQLINFLDWPSYRIEASSVASPYIHETSKKIAEVFENAMKNSPSVLVMDEMEAFLSERNNSSGHHNIEEVAEFLRRIPEATDNEVLIIAMTNKLEMIDSAILRRGRFDHIINVGFATSVEIHSMLKDAFSKISTEDDLDIEYFSERLTEKPLSDVAFFIKEGARIAARSGKDKLDEESLEKALNEVFSREDTPKTNRMGFI